MSVSRHGLGEGIEEEASPLVRSAAEDESVQSGGSPGHVEGRPGHGSEQSSHRLLAYSDALISIIATVMILPVSHIKIRTDQELEESLQQLLATKIAVYIMTFLIVTVAWASHIRLFQVIERIDDVLALLNLACMMLITFLPYTFSLMASFPDDTLGILAFCVCAIIIGLIQAIIVIYGFHQPYLLNAHVCALEDRNSYKYQILKVTLQAPVLFFIAGIISFIYCPVQHYRGSKETEYAWIWRTIIKNELMLQSCTSSYRQYLQHMAYVVLALVIFLPYVTQITQWCGNKIKGRKEIQRVLFYTFHPNEPLSKERVEAFSDGVYAIVATLLILDICEDNVPESKEVADKFHGKLFMALSEYGPEFLAYFGSFVTVGLLWFVHHSLFLYITKTTRLMGLLNTLSLAFIGGLPLAFRLTQEFAAKSRNEIEAIQINCVIIFLASLFQFAIWIVALYNEKETLHRHIRYGGKEHTFMFAKLSLYPSVAFVTFCLTYILSRFSTQIFHLMQIVVPFAFVLLRIIVRITLIIVKWLFNRLKPRTSVLKEEEECAISVSE
ncbi:endosomal/lysosomal proton channel TMEM175 isoform X1 [Hypanus sabinus]|uniref:endosomal/lysosomal proton channel TMEM175 isoform X1 n=1 Tax=Hypanus sabinus TaxID=79690 RepID=UPI0028C376E7|nr:endosomal/lysosomal proton channel TMEM175 isoform X1 [Hypanus sabinus]